MVSTRTLGHARILMGNYLHEHKHTRGCWVLPKVLRLVSAEDALGLRFRGRSPREFLVEVHDALHTHSIGGSCDGLHISSLAWYMGSSLKHIVFLVANAIHYDASSLAGLSLSPSRNVPPAQNGRS